MEDFQALDNPEQNLRLCWEAYTNREPSSALWHALQAEKFLKQHETTLATPGEMLEALYRKGISYYIIASAYLLNEHYEGAFALEQHFLLKPSYWLPLKEYISNYLQMLMIKKQRKHLHRLFEEHQFKSSFIHHYEAYMSLFVDATTTITHMKQVLPIINTVNAHWHENKDGDYL